MNKNCDFTIGPCACGAWHTENEIKDILTKEIESRKELLTQMVGTLYPSIVRDEIAHLRSIWYDKFGDFRNP